MRTVKKIVLGLLAAALIILGVANMAPVDLYLLPRAIFGEGWGISGVPLAVVILVAVLAGIVIGQLVEFIRERKHRRVADERRREIVELRREVARLRAELGPRADELPRIPVG
jgi:uncharacterized integral membrane protein